MAIRSSWSSRYRGSALLELVGKGWTDLLIAEEFTRRGYLNRQAKTNWSKQSIRALRKRLKISTPLGTGQKVLRRGLQFWDPRPYDRGVPHKRQKTGAEAKNSGPASMTDQVLLNETGEGR